MATTKFIRRHCHAFVRRAKKTRYVTSRLVRNYFGISLSDSVKSLIPQVRTGDRSQTTRIFARANRLERRPHERIIELVARLQFNRQMGEASGAGLEPKMMSEIATSPVAFIKRFATQRAVSCPFPRDSRGDPSPSPLSSGQIGIKQSRLFKLYIVTERLISQSIVLTSAVKNS